MAIPKEIGVVNYKKLKKLRTTNLDLEIEEVKENHISILETLGEAFYAFEEIVKMHPYYSSNKNIDDLDVKGYVDKNFGDVIENAIQRGDYKKINDVCLTVGKVYAPKNYGFLKKKKEQYALSNALNSFIKQYALSLKK